jgi:hypothetical protein
MQIPANESEPISVALCVVAKNENDDIVEWVEHHRAIGVDQVFLIDNDSLVRLDTVPGLAAHIRSGFVHYSFLPQRKRCSQLFAYAQCLRTFKHNHTFMGFIDADEFIVIRNPNATIKSVLRNYTSVGGVALQWMLFGSNQLKTRPAGGLVANYHTKCVPDNRIKTIVNVKHVAPSPFYHHPHNFLYQPGYFTVDTLGRPVAGLRNANSTNGRSPYPQAFDVMYLNHYALKSEEEFKIKMARGGGMGDSRRIDFFEEINRRLQRSELCNVLLSRMNQSNTMIS